MKYVSSETERQLMEVSCCSRKRLSNFILKKTLLWGGSSERGLAFAYALRPLVET